MLVKFYWMKDKEVLQVSQKEITSEKQIQGLNDQIWVWQLKRPGRWVKMTYRFQDQDHEVLMGGCLSSAVIDDLLGGEEFLAEQRMLNARFQEFHRKPVKRYRVGNK